jgi:hypothetical protein
MISAAASAHIKIIQSISHKEMFSAFIDSPNYVEGTLKYCWQRFSHNFSNRNMLFVIFNCFQWGVSSPDIKTLIDIIIKGLKLICFAIKAANYLIAEGTGKLLSPWGMEAGEDVLVNNAAWNIQIGESLLDKQPL